MEPTFEPLPLSLAQPIAGYSIAPQEHMHVEVGQAEHRIRLINLWRIPRGSRVLEIGCGQGTTTTALAEAVGPTGHVDAVDPGSPDYGAPWTLGQAQAHISKGEIGGRITWHYDNPTRFLQAGNGDQQWDFVVFAHCIWYFDRPEVLTEMLTALKGKAKYVLIAEHAMKATEKAALPHVLASMTRAVLEAHNKDSEANIRSLMSPASIKAITGQANLELETEDIVIPEANLLDGSWEVGTVKSPRFEKEIQDIGVDNPRTVAMLKSSRDAVLNAIAALEGEKVRSMDVWVARFAFH